MVARSEARSGECRMVWPINALLVNVWQAVIGIVLHR
jgi:hypothetical protein